MNPDIAADAAPEEPLDRADWAAAVAVFDGLSRQGRLAVFRAIIRQGQAGIGPRELQRELRITGSALTLHLRVLSEIGLIHARRAGARTGDRAPVFVADLERLVGAVRLVLGEAADASGL